MAQCRQHVRRAFISGSVILLLGSSALTVPAPPADLRLAASGSANELALLELDVGLDATTAELAIMQGTARLNGENAAVYYLQAMLVRPDRSDQLAAVHGTAERFELLAGDEYADLVRTIDVDTLVRSALQCQRCDFQIDTTRGVSTPLPHLREAPWLCEFLAIRADHDLVNGRPWSALRRYLDVRAIGRDIAQGVGIVSPLAGIRLETMQQQRMLAALPTLIRGGVPAASIERLYDHENRPSPTVRTAFVAETLFQDSLKQAISALGAGDVDGFWARLQALHGLRSGKTLRDLVVERRALSAEQLDDPQAIAAFAAEELLVYTRHVDRLISVMELPATERAGALRSLNEDLVQDLSRGILTLGFAPVLPQFADEVLQYQRNICAMRLLLSAIATRERSGSYPVDLEALRARRPEVKIINPHDGTRFEYVIKDETVIISWSPARAGDTGAMKFTWPLGSGQ